jgi:hypothetical protein
MRLDGFDKQKSVTFFILFGGRVYLEQKIMLKVT